MNYRRLGQTDIQVSVLCLGCWPFAGGDNLNWGPQDDADSVATVHAALDCGITFFDTAEGYGHGHSEEVLGRALAGVGQEAIVATKASASHLAAPDLTAACERSLKRLGRETVDLYQVHWPNHSVPLAETFAALEALKRAGKIRAIGVSNFGARDLADFLATGRCETNQLAYNLLWRAIEFDVLPLCAEEGIGILSYSSLLQGLLTGKFRTAADVPDGRARTRHFSSARPHARHGEPGCERKTFEAIDRIRGICREAGLAMTEVATAWLAHQPGVASVITGARSPGQIRQIAPAGELTLAPDVLSALGHATDDIKEHFGPGSDMWAAESRIH